MNFEKLTLSELDSMNDSELPDVFKTLSSENIGKIKDDEVLLEIFYRSITMMMEVRLIKEERHEVSKNIITPKITDISSGFAYGPKEIEDVNNQKNIYEVKIPVYDEQKRDRYKKRKKSLPETGKFVRADADMTVRPLGLLKLLIWGAQLSRMDKDTRILTPNYTFKVTDYWYYNYAKKEYKMINEEELEKIKDKQRKGKKVNFDQIEDENIRIYLEREMIIEVVESRLKAYAEFFQDKFEESFKIDRYNVKWKDEEIVLDPTGKPIETTPKIKDIGSYMERYTAFINIHLPKWLKLKLVFSSITIREKEELDKEIDRLSSKILKLAEQIGKLENIIKPKIIKKLQDKNEELDPEVIKEMVRETSWSEIDDNKEFDEGVIKDNCLAIFKELARFTVDRPEIERDSSYPEKGYIRCDVENWEVFPNIAEIERRRSLTNEHFSLTKEEKYINELLQFSKNKRG